MSPSLRHFLSRTGCIAALGMALLLGACGGGGDSAPPPAPTAPQAGAFPPSSSVAGVCTAEGEKQFVRSYLDEVYLWNDEIPAVDPAAFSSTSAYFNALLVRTPDASGQPRDRFSAVLTSAAADAQTADRADALKATHTGSTSPVPLSKVVTSSRGRSVGYVLLNNHDRGAQDALIASFEELRGARVQDLVLDLRYNSGGFLYVARTAASLVTGPASEGRIFEQLRYNSKRQAQAPAPTYLFSSRVEAPELRYGRGETLPQLSLPRVYVLTSGLTCSASESIINSLRGIDVEVILIGETTCGKPYGFQRKDNCGLAFYPIEFQGYNAKGFGDFADGFAPTCAVADDFGSSLGATSEPLLATALHHIDTGACPAVPAARPLQSLQKQDLSLPTRAFAPQGRTPAWAGKLLLP